jgi:hypothetical protein
MNYYGSYEINGLVYHVYDISGSTVAIGSRNLNDIPFISLMADRPFEFVTMLMASGARKSSMQFAGDASKIINEAKTVLAKLAAIKERRKYLD